MDPGTPTPNPGGPRGLYPPRRPQDLEGHQHTGCHMCHTSLVPLSRSSGGLPQQGGGSPASRRRCPSLGHPPVPRHQHTCFTTAQRPSWHIYCTKTKVPGPPLSTTPRTGDHATPNTQHCNYAAGHAPPPATGRARAHPPTTTTRAPRLLGLPPGGGPRLTRPPTALVPRRTHCEIRGLRLPHREGGLLS